MMYKTDNQRDNDMQECGFHGMKTKLGWFLREDDMENSKDRLLMVLILPESVQRISSISLTVMELISFRDIMVMTHPQ